MPEFWYRNGLRFECTSCGRCCTGPRGGVVWVTMRECKQIAKFLALPLPKLLKLFTRMIGRRRTLRERRGGECVFYDTETKGCRVHTVKPRQCQSFPFWGSNLESVETWVEAARSCEGIGRGELFTEEEITHRLRMIRM